MAVMAAIIATILAGCAGSTQQTPLPGSAAANTAAYCSAAAAALRLQPQAGATGPDAKAQNGAYDAAVKSALKLAPASDQPFWADIELVAASIAEGSEGRTEVSQAATRALGSELATARVNLKQSCNIDINAADSSETTLMKSTPK